VVPPHQYAVPPPFQRHKFFIASNTTFSLKETSSEQQTQQRVQNGSGIMVVVKFILTTQFK
jgi:hypothetical protein